MPTVRCFLTTAAAGLACAVAPTTASAAAEIERAWTYSGGQVAIKAQADGTLTGTVIRETKLAQCVHPVGEPMWTGMTLQPDGQYFGRHQWYEGSGASCSPTVALGNSAWRLLRKPDGSAFVRFCTASDKRPDQQPSIAPDGTPSNFGRACFDSDPVAKGKKPSFNTVVVLPRLGKGKCVRHRSFNLRLKDPAGDALASGTVSVNGNVVKTLTREQLTKRVKLTRLPKGSYRLRVVTETVLGQTIQGSKRLRTCR